MKDILQVFWCDCDRCFNKNDEKKLARGTVSVKQTADPLRIYDTYLLGRIHQAGSIVECDVFFSVEARLFLPRPKVKLEARDS